MDVVNQQVGEAKLEVKLLAGKLVLSFTDVHESGSVTLSASEDAGYFLDKLEAAIPGAFSKDIIELAKAAIKSLP